VRFSTFCALAELADRKKRDRRRQTLAQSQNACNAWLRLTDGFQTVTASLSDVAVDALILSADRIIPAS
jgi:hypothetical protein